MIDQVLNVSFSPSISSHLDYLSLEDDFIDYQVFISEAQFDALLNEEEIATDFRLLAWNTPSWYYETQGSLSTPQSGRKQRLRADLLNAIDQINAKLVPHRARKLSRVQQLKMDENNNNPGYLNNKWPPKARRFNPKPQPLLGVSTKRHHTHQHLQHRPSHVTVQVERSKTGTVDFKYIFPPRAMICGVCTLIFWIAMMACFIVAIVLFPHLMMHQ